MKIAVLSGKGGTGKTTIAASLVASMDTGQYIDCDVEEPNGYIFLKPEIKESLPVEVLVPEVDAARCTGCGCCAQACQFNAIAVVKENVLIFPEICHHCGACAIACPEDAITEVPRTIGVIEMNNDETFLQGRLNIGDPISIPIIIELKKRAKEDMPVIIDCPPGASCVVVQSIEECDYCILVTEPTPFGLHDIDIAIKLVRKMDIPFGVVINKAAPNVSMINEFCHKEGIDILMELPFSREIAQAYSKGILPVGLNGRWKDEFKTLYEKVKRGASR